MDAEPALQGFKAIVANQKFKYLVAFVLVAIIAIVVPVVIFSRGDVTIEEALQCGSRNVNQANYRGKVAVTHTGIPCQRWDEQFPHSHSYDPITTNSTELEENYCRNPDGSTYRLLSSSPGKVWLSLTLSYLLATEELRA